MDQNGTAHPFGEVTGAPPVQALMFHPTTSGDAAVVDAFAQLGKPYIWGGNGPDGYDCSGLALASWKHAAGVSFARVANDQYHTALYVGGGRIVEATGDHVQLHSLGQWGTGDVMPNGRRP